MPQPATLPVMKNGIPLGATDIRRALVNIEYLNSLAGGLNLPTLPIGINTTRYIFHQATYLHWRVDWPYSVDARDVDFEVNGTPIYSWSKAAHYFGTETGVYDLSGLGLTANRPYTIRLDTAYGGVDKPSLVYVLETNSMSLAASVPNPYPTFSDGLPASANDLNNLFGNIQALYDAAALTPTGGFLQWVTNIDNGQMPTRAWYILHLHDYVYLNCEIWGGYRVDQIVYGRLYYNNVLIWNDQAAHETLRFEEWIDISSLGLTVGQWYEVRFETDREHWWDLYTYTLVDMVAETPSVNIP